MKTRKIFSLLFAATMMMTAINCTNEDEAITYSMTDVSSRITGFNSDITGAGATLSVTGSEMDKVLRIFIGNLVVPKRNFTNVSPSGFTFIVPTTAAIGAADVLFVWPGSERGWSSIEVVPLQVINSMHPLSGSEGEVITIHGANLNIVNGVTVGSTAATISQNTGSMIQFTVPAGAQTGKVTLTSPAGVVSSASDLVSCDADPANVDCAPSLTLNAGFEGGAGDNFDNWSKFNGGNFMLAASSADEVFRGTRALKVIRDGSLSDGQWRIQLASDLVPTVIGDTYTVYAWVRASVAGGSMRFSTQPNALYAGDVSIPTTWTRISWSFTANEANTRVMLDMNGNNTAVTTFYIDDVKLLKN